MDRCERRSAPSPTPGRDRRPVMAATSLGAAGVASVPERRSPSARADGSPGAARDVADASRRCGWCRRALEQTQLLWCSKRCRQTAWRARKLAVIEDLGGTTKRLAYGDPPFPGLSRKYYRDEPTFAGEVDHAELVAHLQTFDGWALSTSAKALRYVLPLCPPEARVCAWVKANGASVRTRGPHNTWEPLIVKPARLRRPGVRDWLFAKPARGGGTLPGRKPLAFCMWLFQLLGASPRDSLADLFPGTGVVSKAFGQFQAAGLRRNDVS